MKHGFIRSLSLAAILVTGSHGAESETSFAHLQRNDLPPPPMPTESIGSFLPKTTAHPLPEDDLYTVTAQDLPVRQLLTALARDAKVDIDIHPGITGNITLNAVNQPLERILARIARQIDMRFEIEGNALAILPDSPFLRHYKVDYVNVARQTNGTISTNTQISTQSPGGLAPAAGNPGTSAGNTSNTRIEHSSKNQFWESLEKNIKDILRETDKILPDGSSETTIEENASRNASGPAAAATLANPLASAAGNRKSTRPVPGAILPNAVSSAQSAGTSVIRHHTFREAASVIVHAETGIVTVRATQRQHEKIQEFIDRVANAAKRQVLIEATIVEVALKDGYQQGINWSQLIRAGSFGFIGNSLTSGASNLKYTRSDNNPSAFITLLDTFGSTKVLSSPRVSVLNNQTALLKVVENYVYFSVKADTLATANVGTTTTYTTTPQSVSVGLVLSVTPQVGNAEMVTLNVRPTISSIAREIQDPNPELIKNSISNWVPVIRTREIESVMRIRSGEIAVLGGLMEEKIDRQTQRVPALGQIPLLGEIVTNRNNNAQKTELVIFLRPLIIKDASIDGDQRHLREFLPGKPLLRQDEMGSP